MKLQHFSPLIAVLLATFMLFPVGAQDSGGDGRGIVRIGNDRLYDGSSALEPLLKMRLFDVDPATGALLDARQSDRALVEVLPPNLPSDEVTLRLRQDRFWNDGAPITAYDVLYSLLTYTRGDILNVSLKLSVIGARVIDERTIALRFSARDDEDMALLMGKGFAHDDYRTPTCDDLPRANTVLLLPSHTLPEFRAFVDDTAPTLPDQPSLFEWIDAYYDTTLPFLSAEIRSALTAGTYHRDDTFSNDSIRYVPIDGMGAVLERQTRSRLSVVEAFIAGETNVLLNVPLNERARLRALSDADLGNLQIAEVPGREALIVLLNFANTGRSLPAFHPVTGEPLVQGQHPLFSDINVRRALQLAIDPQAIIETVMQRSAMPLAGLYAPGSWAFDPTLKPAGTNIAEARRLLDEAGWRDNGVVRQCDGCATAPDGTQLRFTLGSNGEDDGRIAGALAEQWAQIGVGVAATGNPSRSVTDQTFDAYLMRVGRYEHASADPDPAWMLTPMGDDNTVNMQQEALPMNYGSYNNPDVTALIEQARSLPGCDPAARAQIYHQLERVLQADLPFLSVIAPTEFYAASPNVIGFAPRAGDPFWNVEDWVVAP